jgi:limonene-1,2-epoxide hydrolase
MVELKIKQIDPKTREALLEAPDGFLVAVPPLAEHFNVGDIFTIEDELWQQWRDFWALGPPIAQWVEMAELKRHTYNNKVWIPLYAATKPLCTESA